MISYGASQFQEIKDFVDTDFWVRSRITIPGPYSSKEMTKYCYVNIVSADEHFTEYGDYKFSTFTYNIRYVYLTLLSKGEVYHCSQADKDRILNRIVKDVKSYNITLLQPLEVATTDELFYIDH